MDACDTKEIGQHCNSATNQYSPLETSTSRKEVIRALDRLRRYEGREMRIVIATFTFPPERNGVSEVTFQHALGFVKRGHNVCVVTNHNPARRIQDFGRMGIEIREFAVRGWRRYTGDILGYQQFLQDLDGDVVFFHCWQAWPFDLAIPILRSLTPKKILVSHGLSTSLIFSPRDVVSWLLWRPYSWSVGKVLRSLDHVVFLADQEDDSRFADVRVARRLGSIDYSIIPNAATLSESTEPVIDFRKKHGIKTRFVVLHVGEFNKLKNQAMAVRAFIESGVPNATLVLIGSGPEGFEKDMTRIITGAGTSPNIQILRDVSRPDIAAAYQAADLFVSSSLSEAQPLVLLDAMNAGVPFISTDVGCVRELEGGIVVSTVGQMAAAIKSLIGDEQKRKQLGQSGRTACEFKYNWKAVIDSYEDLINKMMDIGIH